MLQSAALLFFAFAGYARIATLGEEVRDPQRTIPRAIPIALGLVVVLYLIVGAAALAAAAPNGLRPRRHRSAQPWTRSALPGRSRSSGPGRPWRASARCSR